MPPEQTIVHPETVVSFGSRAVYWPVVQSTDFGVSYLDLVEYNLWPSSLVARRTLLLNQPYVPQLPENGYGPEDWAWNIQTVSAGIQHLTAPESVFLYRLREHNGVNKRHEKSILPYFDFTALREAFPGKEAAAERCSCGSHLPSRKVPTAQLITIRMRAVLHFLGQQANPKIKGRLKQIFQRGYAALFHAEFSTPMGTQLCEIHGSRPLGRGLRTETQVPLSAQGHISEAFRQLTYLEPAISWAATNIDEVPHWNPSPTGYTKFLEQAFDGIAGKSALVAVPWIGIGGADMVALNYANALAQSERYRGKSAILGTYLPERTWLDLIPAEVSFHQVDPDWRSLTPEAQKRLLAQLILLARPELIISVNCFDITNSLACFSRQMTERTKIFLTLFAWDRIGHGFPTNPITDDPQRIFLDDIQAIISDNTVTSELIEDRLALSHSKTMTHYQPAYRETPQLTTASRAYTDSNFSEEHPLRLVWPHRLDKEKCPQVLPDIMSELHRRGMWVQLDIWGQQVLSSDGDALMRTLKVPGIAYRGPYQGGLPGIDISEYHALLLTSESEGLPLVLVQSLMEGLPVVASNVGGVSEVIHDGKSGLLADGPQDIHGFADAVERLYESVELRQRLIETGYALGLLHV